MLTGRLEEGSAFCGSVRQELLVDQLETVIVEDHGPEGGRVLENPKLLRQLGLSGPGMSTAALGTPQAGPQRIVGRLLLRARNEGASSARTCPPSATASW
jgi:hypothetical protein